VHTGLSGVTAEQRLLRAQRSSATAFNALQCAPESEHAQLVHRTVYRTCPVHHRTAREAPQVRAPTVEPQRLADVASAPDSVRWCTGLSDAPCDCSLPTTIFGGWGLLGRRQRRHPSLEAFADNRWSDRDRTGRDTLRSIRHQTKTGDEVIPQRGLVQP
jgi:hypothetical protein